jgi:hypothetical protein
MACSQSALIEVPTLRRALLLLLLFLALSPLAQVQAADPSSLPAPIVLDYSVHGTRPKISYEQLANQCVFTDFVPDVVSKSGCTVEWVHLVQYSDLLIGIQFQTSGKFPEQRHSLALFETRTVAKDFEPINAETIEGADSYNIIGFQAGMLGTFLVIKGISGATGRGINYAVLEKRQDGWWGVEADQWHSNRVNDFLPHGFFAAAPETIDFGVGLTIAKVYNPKDPMCCPSAGTVVIELARRGDAFVVSNVKLVRDLH